MIGLAGLGLTLFFLWFFTDFVGIYKEISKIMASALVLFWNFIARKVILFQKDKGAGMIHDEA